MRKSTLFISAVLTTFVMAMLAGVASAYQNAIANNAGQAAADTQVQTQPQPEVKAISHAMSADSQFTLAPEEAAGLAAQVIGREDLYSVEVTDLNGENVYMVTFSSGDLVYVSLDGQILSLGKVEVSTTVVTTKKNNDGQKNNKKASASSNQQNQGSHEDHDDDDHEDHEDHDDD